MLRDKAFQMRAIKELLLILLNEYQDLEGETYRNTIYADNGYGFGIITKKAVDKLRLTNSERYRLLAYLRSSKTEYINQFLWWPMGFLNAERIEFLKKLISEL